MQRRLEDVSHFFFDHRGPNPSHQSPARAIQRAERRPRIIYVGSLGHEFTVAVVVSGLATTAARLGRRVLVAETREQPFGIAFGFGFPTPRGGSPVIEAASGLWVTPVPLLGTKRPGVLFDPLASAEWRARATQADLVLVQVDVRDGSLRTPAMPIPDEYLVVAGGGATRAPSHSYRAIKRAVSSNPSLELGLIVVGEQDEISGRAHDKLVRAVAKFLGRQCPVVGSVPGVSALSYAFVSGAVLREWSDEITRAIRNIADRWAVPTGERSASALPAGGRGEGRLCGGVG